MRPAANTQAKMRAMSGLWPLVKCAQIRRVASARENVMSDFMFVFWLEPTIHPIGRNSSRSL